MNKNLFKNIISNLRAVIPWERKSYSETIDSITNNLNQLNINLRFETISIQIYYEVCESIKEEDFNVTMMLKLMFLRGLIEFYKPKKVALTSTREIYSNAELANKKQVKYVMVKVKDFIND